MFEKGPALRLGVSACLLGQPVRFDGGHKRDRFVVETLGRYVEWVPVCPEDEAGLGTPREAMRLVRSDGTLRVMTSRTGRDLTAALCSGLEARVEQLAAAGLSGYVLKKDSPSCGMARVKVYDASGYAKRDGQGVFAAALQRRLPLLPVEEEGRLNDMAVRETFIERIHAFARLSQLIASPWRPGGLVAFHAEHKLALLAHDPAAYRELGRLVARAGEAKGDGILEEYAGGLMQALRTVPSRGRHVNALQHAFGYFTRPLDADSRGEVLSLIGQYAEAVIARAVPLALLAHHARRLGLSWLVRQTYLRPHPLAAGS